jgi:Holliday junction DNA helicase RuvB
MYSYMLDPDFIEHTCTGVPLWPPQHPRVVFLDEIHRLRPEEPWYKFDGVIVGATTEGAPISDPMMSRMIPVWLEAYTEAEIVEIIDRRCPINEPGAVVVASRVRGTPRTAIQVAEQVQAWAELYERWPRDVEEYGRVLDSFGYYEGGYTEQDRWYIEFLHRNQPCSLETIARGTNMPKEQLRNEIEPWLIRNGVIKIVAGKGRCLS